MNLDQLEQPSNDSDNFMKMSKRMLKPKTPIIGRIENSSGEWVLIYDHKVTSLNPETAT